MKTCQIQQTRRASGCWALSLLAAGLVVACAGPGTKPVTGVTAVATAAKTYGLKIDNGQVGTPAANGKTLLAIYMIGSNLEDDLSPRDGTPDEQQKGGIVTTGSASTNLRQLLAGYNALSPAAKADVDVIIGMGGARKQGWQGIKYQDLPSLINDGKDNYFGNDGPFLFSDPAADMSDPLVFQAFLATVKTRSVGFGKVMLLMWDHGNAYDGVGPDTNHPNGTNYGQLYLSSMVTALNATAFKADIIGFDACMMANLEVCTELKDHFNYLVGSEETEPAQGWDYSLFMNDLGNTPNLTALDLGKKLVDDYIESPANQMSKGRTLSLTDLSKVAAVSSSLNTLSSSFTGALDADYQPLLSVAGAAQHYGREGAAGSEFSLDLTDVSERIKVAAPDVAAPAAALVSALNQAVIYSRESGEKPNSKGLTIFSPVNVNFFTQGFYNNVVAATPPWFDFLGKFVAKGNAATTGPSVSNEQPAAGAAAYRGLLALQPGTLDDTSDGSFSMTIQGSPGVARVSALHVLQPDPTKHRYEVVSGDRVDATTGNTYTLAGWDGSALHLTDSAGANVLAPLTFENLTATGTSVFVAPARVNGQEANVYVEWDKTQGLALDTWVTPFQPGTSKTIVQASKLQASLAQGDTVAFYDSFIDTDANTKTAVLSTAVTLASAPRWVEAAVSGQKLYFMYAQDLKGNVTASNLHLVPDLFTGLGN